MLPGLIEMVQQEQRQDLLKEIEQERLIRAAGLQGVGLGGAVRQMAHWFKQQRWGLRRQAVFSPPAGCSTGSYNPQLECVG